MKRLLALFTVSICLAAVFNSPLFGSNCSRCHTDNGYRKLAKTAGIFEKAVGVMDKGQLQNNTSNFGNLSSYHAWYTNATHWPRSADSNRQYAFGLGFMVGINKNNVIETETQTLSKIQDWLPPDDALGTEYSGEVTAISDQTPFQATSDLPKSWPNETWPGYFRVDVNKLDSLILEEHPDAYSLPEARNQFTSDRDIFCTYNDDYNSMGRVGVTVDQSSYSYGRPYAEDFVFWDLKIHNTSNVDLVDIYVGFYAKFRPDYDNHDYIDFIDTDNDGKKDFVYIYDLNNTSDGAWTESDDPLGIVGLRVYDTPFRIGINNFHHFARAASPKTDPEMWALMTSGKDSSDLVNPDYYFHGDSVNIDYTGADSLEAFYPAWSEDEDEPETVGNAINYVISCGPFTLRADSMATISLGIIMGDAGDTPDYPDTTDLMNNVDTAYEMYKLYFQGSGPPDPPSVQAVAGDNEITLYWSAEPSESSVDVWTEKPDFEGYKIFRSTDFGRTWGRKVTDVYGNFIGYEPITQFDYSFREDSVRYNRDISGIDPMFIDQYLGGNTGLVHTYTDSNLINGVEYWYCVTAYDHGNPDNFEQSYMYPLGASIFETHTVSAIPGKRATNYIETIGWRKLEPTGGRCDATAKIKIVDPDNITGHDYQITFTDTALYSSVENHNTFTNIGKGFTLVDLTEEDTLFYNHILSDETGDNIPVTDGFRLLLSDVGDPEISSMGWTKVNGDTSTFDWWTEKRTNDDSEIPETIYTYDDYKIVILDTSESIEIKFTYYFEMFSDNSGKTIKVPLRIINISNPENPLDITQYAMILDWTNMPGHTPEFYGPNGWDLIPGGAGYSLPYDLFLRRWSDILVLANGPDSSANFLFLKTQNGPDDAIPPSVGDEFTILLASRPFRKSISYIFNTVGVIQQVTDSKINPLKNIRVVPDPYIVTNIWESNEYGKKLQFNHLPDKCTIKIYTLSGEKIATVEHDSPTGYEFWDMRTKNDQFIAPGVYLYYAKTPDGDEATGRFLVIK